MNKVLCRVLCLAMAMMILFTVGASASTIRYVKTGDGKNLNVRSDPWKAADNVIDKIPYRMKVEVTEYTAGNVWAKVRVSWKSGVLEGWVLSSFLVKNDPGPYKGNSGSSSTTPSTDLTLTSLNNTAKAIKVLDAPYFTVIQTQRATNYVHLRWFPDTNAVYSGAYLCNTEIEVLATSKTWAQVRIVEDGKVGFILMNNVAPVVE